MKDKLNNIKVNFNYYLTVIIIGWNKIRTKQSWWKIQRNVTEL